jgi:hypothetical protein
MFGLKAGPLVQLPGTGTRLIPMPYQLQKITLKSKKYVFWSWGPVLENY